VAAIDSEITADTAKWGQSSYNGWKSNVAMSRKFCQNRADYMIKWCRQYGNLSESETIELFGSKGAS
jgi:hypothetical protein